MGYRVLIVDSAVRFISLNVISDRILSRIESAVALLADYPELGPAHNPSYAAARPPFPCRVLPLSDTPFTLYYTVDHEEEAVTVVSVAWSGGDPRRHFS